MARVTRAEQQRQTHERLLAAGRSVLVRRGFLAATVEEIAAEAGYTRGAVYKHFGGKEGLWLAIVEARSQAHLRLLDDALAGASDRSGMVRALTPNAVADDEAARWSVAAAEFMAAVAGQPGLASAVVAAQRRHEEEIAEVLDRHCRRLGIRPALPLPQVVVMLAAVAGGLALRRGVDPEVDVAGIVAGVLGVVFPAAA